jgi:hypothetical protein
MPRLYPACQPKVRLTYEFKSDDDDVLYTWSTNEETIPRNECCLEFRIDDLGEFKTIVYDMVNNKVVSDAPYQMMEFRLLKLEVEGLIYVGVLCKTDYEEGFYNIKLTGRIIRKISESIHYLEVP